MQKKIEEQEQAIANHRARADKAIADLESYTEKVSNTVADVRVAQAKNEKNWFQACGKSGRQRSRRRLVQGWRLATGKAVDRPVLERTLHVV